MVEKNETDYGPLSRNAFPAAALDEVGNEKETWMLLGSCREYPPDVFFPSDGVGVDRARRICRTCPVAAVCLEYALENGEDHGVWGGASERERRRMRKTTRIK